MISRSIAAIALIGLVLAACVPLKQSSGDADAGAGGSGGGTPADCPDAPGYSLHGTTCVADAAPSCEASAGDCGVSSASSSGESCCAGSMVREGKPKPYSRSWDQSDSSIQNGRLVYGWEEFNAAPATVSPFWLDRYEVTVGRFRRFVNDYSGWRSSGNPQKDAGAHYRLPSSGWQSAWTTSFIAADKTGLLARLAPNSTCVNVAWTDAAGPNETLPMNCVNWYDALLFCIWDGGRLPTEAEWNFAATGGSDQRAFPWSSPPSSTVLKADDAVLNRGTAGLLLEPVGSIAGRDGRWGHRDLAGNVVEFVQDACNATECVYADPPTLPAYPLNCSDCFAPFDTAVAQNRMARGGSWKNSEEKARTAYRLVGIDPQNRYDDLGFRCARNPPD